MRIAYTRRALQNLAHHASIIAKDNPAAARDQVARVRATINGLGEFPEMGCPGRVNGAGVLAPRTPFVVIYRVEQEYIVIPRVLHEPQRCR